MRLCAFVAWQAQRTHEHAVCSVRFEKKTFTYMVGGFVHHAEMMCRDPAEVLQEKLLDLEHNPAECMWWKHEIGSDWRKQRFSEPKHSVPGWVQESYMPPGSRILYFTVGSDGTNLDKLGKRHAHPVNIIPGCYDAKTRRKLDSTLTIAHLPHVDGTEERKAMFAAAMNFLFDSLNHAGKHGVDMHIRLGPGPEPTKIRVYTLACQILNDHPEACMGLGVKDSCVTNAPCCGCLTPCTHLQDIPAATRYPVRDKHFRDALEAWVAFTRTSTSDRPRTRSSNAPTRRALGLLPP